MKDFKLKTVLTYFLVITNIMKIDLLAYRMETILNFL